MNVDFIYWRKDTNNQEDIIEHSFSCQSKPKLFTTSFINKKNGRYLVFNGQAFFDQLYATI